MAEHHRIFGLDLMRAVAVSSVMYSHAGFLIFRQWPEKLAYASEAATFGVEIFFVLSGFLVGSIALKLFLNNPTPEDIRNFMLRRWLRTLPAYYVFLAINVWLSNGSLNWKFLLFLQTMDGTEPLHYMNESWSLAVEEWFYILLPPTLLLIAKFKRQNPLALMIGFIVLSIAAHYMLLAAFHFGWRDTYHITLLRLDSIMFGVAAAYLSRAIPQVWDRYKWPCLAIGLALIALPLPHQPASAIANAVTYPRFARGCPHPARANIVESATEIYRPHHSRDRTDILFALSRPYPGCAFSV